MNKNNDKNKTQSTSTVGNSDYKGYNSLPFDGYDDLTDDIESKANSMGGVLDNYSKTYGGQRYKFRTKAERDRFNDYIKKQQDKKKELDKQNKMKENRINRIVLSEIKRYLKEDFKSKQLQDLANQHGGVKGAYVDDGYSQVPMSDITDDMFDASTIKKGRKIDNGGYVRNGMAYQNQRNGIEFNDGYYVPLKKSNVKDIVAQNDDKITDRMINKVDDGSQKYMPSKRRGFLARQARERIKNGYETNSAAQVYLGQQDARKLKNYWDGLKDINMY